MFIMATMRIPRVVHKDLMELQEKWKDEMPFDFTGMAPIIAETESLLTNDIALFLPILVLMVLVVFFTL